MTLALTSHVYVGASSLCSPLLFLPLSLFLSLSPFVFSSLSFSTTPFSVFAGRFDQRCLRSRRMRDDQWGINARWNREILVRVFRTPIGSANANGNTEEKTHTSKSSVLRWRRLYRPGYLSRTRAGNTDIIFITTRCAAVLGRAQYTPTLD